MREVYYVAKKENAKPPVVITKDYAHAMALKEDGYEVEQKLSESTSCEGKI